MAIQFGFSRLCCVALLLTSLCSSLAFAQVGPGQLRFDAAEHVVVEGAFVVNLRVERIGGIQGRVEVAFRTIDGSATAGMDYQARQGTLIWEEGNDNPFTIPILITSDIVDEPDETFTVLLSNPTGGATLVSPSVTTVTIVDDDFDVATPGRIQFTSTQFAVAEPQGSRAITVQRIDGTDGPVTVNYSTNNGSATAGNDYTATSGTLEWADGEGGQKTFNIEVFDDEIDETNETVNLSLSNPTGGAILGTSGATLSILDDDGELGACAEDAFTLCLRPDRRFRVEVDWRTSQGETGRGQTVPSGLADSGLFYFFDSNNAEMLVKVLDGCSVNDHYWVFAAAATNVEYTLTVTDTQTNVSTVYANDVGTPAPAITDTQAFATCP